MKFTKFEAEEMQRRCDASRGKLVGVNQDAHSTPTLTLPIQSDAKSPVIRRLRQSQKPLLNGLESQFYGYLTGGHPDYPPPRAQALRFRLGNGIFYKPDLFSFNWPSPCGLRPTAWEVKGPHAFRGGFENLKVAAGLYHEIRWILVWKDKETGEWREQVILP